MRDGGPGPCPVCGAPNQTCTNPHVPAGPAVTPQDEPTVRPPQGPGPLTTYLLADGSTRKLTAADAARLGLIDEEGS